MKQMLYGGPTQPAGDSVQPNMQDEDYIYGLQHSSSLSPQEYQQLSDYYGGNIPQLGSRMPGAGSSLQPITDAAGNIIGYNRVKNTVPSADDRAIEMQRQQYYDQVAMNQPFADIGIMGLGNMGNYQQGPNFQTMLNEGARALRGSAAAAGLGNSSAAGRNLSSFLNNLSLEDLNRQYQQNLNAIGIGQNAIGALGGAGLNYGNQAGSVFNNQGNVAAQNALNRGQNAANWWQTAGNVIGGLGNYMAYNSAPAIGSNPIAYNYTPNPIIGATA